ncbi:Protein of unknown function [Pyronema omphalodes CBS 100304]|uniref:Uncharacterized protein n=1 Tax=Pyronema omphalodes (strain CBS 100304) TaxID=1076935 RepID=U4LCY6_PYROM|nr:Protein of unknown function [Pyronema omphalodes CBS 100304]
MSVKSTKHINDTTLSDLSKPSSTTARVQRARIFIGNIKKEIHGPDFKKSSSTRHATQRAKAFLGDIRKDIHPPKPSFTSLRSKSASSYTQTIGVPSAKSKCREQSIVLIDNSLSKKRNGNGNVLVSAVNSEVELDILLFKCDKETAKYNANNAGVSERSSYSKGSKSEPAPQPIIKEILRLVDWYRKASLDGLVYGLIALDEKLKLNKDFKGRINVFKIELIPVGKDKCASDRMGDIAERCSCKGWSKGLSPLNVEVMKN